MKMNASEFIKLLSESIFTLNKDKKYSKKPSTTSNRIDFTESNTDASCKKVRIKNDLEREIVCLKFTPFQTDNYPVFFDRYKIGLCQIPEGILFIPISKQKEEEQDVVLCVSIEMKSGNVSGNIGQLYAGKIISEYIIQTVLNSQDKTIKCSCISYYYIGFRFGHLSDDAQDDTQINKKLNDKKIRRPSNQDTHSNLRNGNEGWYEIIEHESKSDFYYNNRFHPCYSSEQASSLSLKTLINAFATQTKIK